MSLRPLPNVKFFPRRKVRQFFFVGACSDGLPGEIGSLTKLVFRQSVDLLITSSTRAPTICLPASWVHIGRFTYPGQKKKLRQPCKPKHMRVHARESTRLAQRLCPSGVRLSQFFLSQHFSTCTETIQKQNITRAKGQLQKKKTDKSTTGQ